MSLDVLRERLSDRWWRLNHLYWIVDKAGCVVRFKPNWAQSQLHFSMHYRNDVLKARQLGISTYTAILILDTCLFMPNYHCGIIDKTLPDAKAKLGKIKFAYDRLDYVPEDASDLDRALGKLGAGIKEAVRITKNDETMKVFSNGAEVCVGTSLRGGTLQLLHVSELGHVAAHAPIRAREIVTGGINTVSMDGVVIKESTHEGGKYGINYEMTNNAMIHAGKELSNLDWKFFFFSWKDNPDYRLEGVSAPTDSYLVKYFETLEREHGIVLDEAQKAWYGAQYRTYGYLVKQEYPTVPAESFETQVEGAIYGAQIVDLRLKGRANAEFEVDDMAPLYVSWDIGMSDYMSMWLWQVGGDGKYYVVDCIQASDKALSWYVAQIHEWERLYYPVKKLLIPHDAARRDWEGVSFEDKLAAAGFDVDIVPRTPDLWASIMAVRSFLRHCVFHERCSLPTKVDGTEYMSGLNALENYQKSPMGANGTVKEAPLHNLCSHAADGFRTFVEAVAAGLVSKHTEFTGLLERNKGNGGLALGVDALLG